MGDFQQYRRSQIAELRPYEPGDGVFAHVSISEEDRKAGSPKLGDMIARNPKNHADQWLVAAQYFKDNFEPMSSAVNSHATLTAALREARGALEQIGNEENYGSDGAWDADSYPDEIANRALATINAALGRVEG